MQGILFLTSNLSSIWHHGEFKNKRVSNKGHLCPHRNTIKCLAEVSACFCTGFPHLQFATQRQISWEEKLVIHIVHHSAGKITSSLPCGCVGVMLFIELCGPIRYTLFRCQLWGARLLFPNRTGIFQFSPHGPPSTQLRSNLHSQSRHFLFSRARCLSSAVTVYCI